jgi:hypothetical protein
MYFWVKITTSIYIVHENFYFYISTSNGMKKHVCLILLILLVYIVIGGSTCQVKSCPPQHDNYNLHHLTEKGFFHIFNIEQDCLGCHHIAAEKCGLVRLEKIKTAKNGVFTAKIEKIKGKRCTKSESTFFPQHWSVQTTLDKIEEAYQKSYIISESTRPEYYSREYNTEEERDTYKYGYQNEVRLGKTTEGISIKIIMSGRNSNKIFNAYPILK